MGALQPGLPNPAMLPQNWPLLIIDLKDCFFTIALHPCDTKHDKLLEARHSHEHFHQNAKGLMREFKISLPEARLIVRACPTCSFHNGRLGIGTGVNPRGLRANEVWQM
ncbi:POK8 protein, partial [Ptilorrhoa leucosticta]|nr:POK8 protein [Ptilorrhoa leucosticta]